jgi:hypothetical protein
MRRRVEQLVLVARATDESFNISVASVPNEYAENQYKLALTYR